MEILVHSEARTKYDTFINQILLEKIANDEDICHTCKEFFKWKRKWNNKGKEDSLAYLREIKKKRGKWKE